MSIRYQIRQKLFSIGDDFWIENQHGQKVFKVSNFDQEYLDAEGGAIDQNK